MAKWHVAIYLQIGYSVTFILQTLAVYNHDNGSFYILHFTTHAHTTQHAQQIVIYITREELADSIPQIFSRPRRSRGREKFKGWNGLPPA